MIFYRLIERLQVPPKQNNYKTLSVHKRQIYRLTASAILSHTWGEGEVTFNDITSALPDERVKFKQGYVKIEYTCTQADHDGLSYAWIDTCRIDKSSSAEFSEAINSMYWWYSMSKVSYVHMSDVPGDHGPISPQSLSRRTVTASFWGGRDSPRQHGNVNGGKREIGHRKLLCEKQVFYTGLDIARADRSPQPHLLWV